MEAVVVMRVARTRALSALSWLFPQTTLAPLDKVSVTCPPQWRCRCSPGPGSPA